MKKKILDIRLSLEGEDIEQEINVNASNPDEVTAVLQGLIDAVGKVLEQSGTSSNIELLEMLYLNLPLMDEVFIRLLDQSLSFAAEEAFGEVDEDLEYDNQENKEMH